MQPIEAAPPDTGKGRRVVMTFSDKKPYSMVSIDTFTLGKIRLFRGPNNANVRKKVILALSCLISGHISLEPIENLTPVSIAAAMWRVEERFNTKIKTIFSDNFPSLRENSLGPELSELHKLKVSVQDVVAGDNDLTFSTNLSYVKCRIYVERKIRDIRQTMRQFTVIKKSVVLSWESNSNLLSAICAK